MIRQTAPEGQGSAGFREHVGGPSRRVTERKLLILRIQMSQSPRIDRLRHIVDVHPRS
jgi:hypothetical protein